MVNISDYAPAKLNIVDNSALLSTYADLRVFYIEFWYRKTRGYIRQQEKDRKNTVDNS